MVLTHSQLLEAFNVMREQGIVWKHGPVAVSFAGHGWYQPTRFHWDNDHEPTDQVMIYGPVYHNDNTL